MRVHHSAERNGFIHKKMAFFHPSVWLAGQGGWKLCRRRCFNFWQFVAQAEKSILKRTDKTASLIHFGVLVKAICSDMYSCRLWIHMIISYMNSYMNSCNLWIDMIISYMNSYGSWIHVTGMNSGVPRFQMMTCEAWSLSDWEAGSITWNTLSAEF